MDQITLSVWCRQKCLLISIGYHRDATDSSYSEGWQSWHGVAGNYRPWRLVFACNSHRIWVGVAVASLALSYFQRAPTCPSIKTSFSTLLLAGLISASVCFVGPVAFPTCLPICLSLPSWWKVFIWGPSHSSLQLEAGNKACCFFVFQVKNLYHLSFYRGEKHHYLSCDHVRHFCCQVGAFLNFSFLLLLHRIAEWHLLGIHHLKIPRIH